MEQTERLQGLQKSSSSGLQQQDCTAQTEEFGYVMALPSRAFAVAVIGCVGPVYYFETRGRGAAVQPEDPNGVTALERKLTYGT